MSFLMRCAYGLLRLYWGWFRPITIGVRILLVQDDGVVLVRHTYLRGWHMPGGGMKRGETLSEGAAREAWEEVGAKLDGEPQLLGIYTAFLQGKSDHTAVFFSDSFVLETPPEKWDTRWEIAEVKRFPIDALPHDISRSVPWLLQQMADGTVAQARAWPGDDEVS